MPTTIQPFAEVRIGLAGPMLGVNEGWVTSQHEILAKRLTADGAKVSTTSSIPARIPRLVDTLRTVLSWRGSVDVMVIAVFSGPGFWIADMTSRLAHRLGIPQILVLHGGNLPEYARNHQGRVTSLLRRAEAIVAPSRFLAEQIPSNRSIRVIPNIFDIESITFQPRSRLRPRILWMRTFHPIYNPLLAIDVVALLRRTHPDATLTMAGQEKGMRDPCIDRAESLGISDAVAFPGFLDEQRKRQALDDHDVFINTNDVDNTPVSVLEAAAAGLPIVATNVGGMPYLMEDGIDALLVPPGDPTSMASAVEALLSDESLAARLSQNARRRALESSWDSVGPQWRSLIENVLAATSDP